MVAMSSAWDAVWSLVSQQKLLSKRELKREQTVGQRGHKQVDGFSPESGKNNKKIRKQMNEKVRKVGLKLSQEIQILQKRNVDKNLIN